MNLVKKYFYSLLVVIVAIIGTVSFGVKKADAVSVTCNYTHKYLCCGDGSKTVATGSVTINHNISVVGGLKSSYNIGDTINFNYSWDGSFTATGGAWDTPTVLKCNSWNGCFANFVGATRANTYTQKITDSTGKTGYIQWQADEGGVGSVIFSSSDPSVVNCSGSICTVAGNGTATITATTSTVWVRLFSKIFNDASPTGWYASLAPEGYIEVPGRGYITGNSTLLNGCVIRNMKGAYTDPPVSSTSNYKGIRLPMKTQDFTINVRTNPTAVIDIPSTSPTSYNQGGNVTFTGHGVTSAGSLDYYMWVDTDGTYTPNGRCDSTVGTVLDQGTTFDATDSTSFATNALSLGSHRICFNLRERFPDGSALWAGAAGKSDFVDVTINQSLPNPDLKINGSDGPITNVPTGGNLNLTWSAVSDATSCSATSGAGWTGTKSISGGNENVTASTDSTYTLECTGPGGTASDSVNVNICTPSSYSYTCTSNPPSQCANNCGSYYTNQCIKTSTDASCPTSPTPVNLSNCTDCPAQVACPACPNESNWIEVKP